MEGRSAPTKGFCKSRFTYHFFLRRFDLPPARLAFQTDSANRFPAHRDAGLDEINFHMAAGDASCLHTFRAVKLRLYGL